MYDAEMLVGIQSAYMQALKSFKEGGVPVGSALLCDGGIVSLGHNRRVQKGSNILHGEMDCIENAGHHADLAKATLFTTLSPCLMCSNAIRLFKISRVVILDDINTKDYDTSVEALRSRGVEVIIRQHQPSIELNAQFQNDPTTRKIWVGDVGS